MVSARSAPLAVPDPAPAVELREVTFCWPGQARPVLDIPALTVPPGGQVFIEGPSGSGKSTLLGLIAGILPPASGTVTVNGVRISELSGARRDAFRGEHIGFIFQQFNLIPYLSMLENVLIPCRLSPARQARAGHRGSRAAARDLLERLDLPAALWNRPVHRLSVGQQQRVAAARALMGKPSLLIADEPTSALDADRRTAFLELLLKECSAAAASLLFVSHDRGLGAAFATRIHLCRLNRAAEAVPV